MRTPTMTVLCNSFRPGGMDITFRALQGQTYKNFELIIVDRRYEKRHDAVMALAKESGVRTLHVPEHRRNGKWAVLSAAWNTGLMLALGRYITFLPDYSYVPPDWIERHLEMQAIREAVIMAPYLMFNIPPVVDKLGNPVTPVDPLEIGPLCPRIREMPDDRFDEISIFPERFDPSWLPSLVPWPDERQCARRDMKLLASLPPMRGHFHMRNECMPREWPLEINGFDEVLDRGKSCIDTEFSRRLSTRHPMFPVPVPLMTMLDPHGLFPTMPQRGVGRWTQRQCEMYAVSTSEVRADNPFNVWEKAFDLAKWRQMERVPTEGLDVPDADYYR